MTAREAAEYFLVRAAADDEGMTLLKLQKLLYYAQGFHLALNGGEPLFDEPILRWEHGPVVRSIWEAYAEFRGGRLIDAPAEINMGRYDQESREFLDEVWVVYGQFSAWKLRDMTHDERPWAETAQNQEIPRALMTEFFLQQLQDG